MVCLTSPEAWYEVVVPFLVLYVQMAVLAQVQRASLLAFDRRITEAIQNAHGKFSEMEGKILDSLIEIEEDFAIFQGQLLLQEVTPQIQGIEIYERLQRMLFIDKLETSVQRQLNNLYEIAESRRAKQQEKQYRDRKDQEKRDKEDAEEKSHRQESFLSTLAVLSIFSAWTDLTSALGSITEWGTCLSSIVSFFIVLALVFLLGWPFVKQLFKKRREK